MRTNLRQQFSRFLIGGFFSVSLDWGTYYLLTQITGTRPIWAKLIGFLIGTIFSFYFNGIISFHSTTGTAQMYRHFCLYGFSMSINVAIFHFIAGSGSSRPSQVSALGLIVATLSSLLINFFGLRNWVFKESREID
jgi:putative flippase GtrA